MLVIVRRSLFLVVFALLSAHGAMEAQDIELLGKIHGTRPPQGYYDLMERDPGAFQFQRALYRRTLRTLEFPAISQGGLAVSAARDLAFARLLAGEAERTQVSGTFNFPLILGYFSDSPGLGPGFGQAAVQAEFFEGPQVNPGASGTIPDFYGEISGGLASLVGATFPWVTTPLTQSDVSAGGSGLDDGSRVGEFIVRILEELDDGSVDWGLFDNDGPDGVPNSGDDDGYVDVLSVMHPTAGGECSSSGRENRIWSHRWNLFWNSRFYGSAWTPSVRQSIEANFGYVTETPSLSPETAFIKVLDYTIQPVLACNGQTINSIGVFAHELGHGFGLPDLYVTASNQDHNGVGNWGLMGTGSWGCDGSSASSPCHMSPWSKEALGWVDIQVLPPDTDLGTLTLPPVETSGRVYRVESGDPSEDYLLIENRQRVGFDEFLLEPGLLVWQIDPPTIRNPPGGINNDPDRMGVWLRQADGRNDLGRQRGGRGDEGDPFPGTTGNTAFHAGSDPGAWSHDGDPMGITLLDIQQDGLDMAFRALTRYQTLTLRTEGSPSGEGLVWVDGTAPPQASELEVSSAPFQTHILEAAAGEEVEDGVRVAFQGWSDGAPRVREHTTQLENVTFTATYGGTEYLLDVTQWSPAAGIVPGQIHFSGGVEGGWIPQGEMVSVTAIPRIGFGFEDWGGALAGQANPAQFTATAPADATANFEVTFTASSNPPTIRIDGGVVHVISLQVQNANLPVWWTLNSGTLPPTLSLDATGSLRGVPLSLGEFPVNLRATDAIGLQGDAAITLIVEDPEVPVQNLASPFLLTGASITSDLKLFLDREGNSNGSYDLGDFRAFVLRNPGVPLTGEFKSLVEMTIQLGDLKTLSPPGEARKEELR